MISTGNLKSGLNLKLLSCLWPAFQAFSTAMFDFKKRSRNSYLYSPPFSAVMKLIWWRPQQYDHKQAAFTHSKNSSASQFRQRLALYTNTSFPCSTDNLTFKMRPNCKTFSVKMTYICVKSHFHIKSSALTLVCKNRKLGNGLPCGTKFFRVLIFAIFAGFFSSDPQR